jgi:hypothetical protein
MNRWSYLGLIAGIFIVGCIVGFDILKLLSTAHDVPRVEYVGFVGLMLSAILLFKDHRDSQSG